MQSSEEQGSLKEEVIGSPDDGTFSKKEDDISEEKVNSSVNEVQKTSHTSAAKKQPSHNKQRTSGIVNHVLGFSHCRM